MNPISDSSAHQTTSTLHSLRDAVKNPRVVAATCGIIVLTIAALLLLPGKPAPDINEQTPPRSFPTRAPTGADFPTQVPFTPEQLIKIEAQRQADETVAKREVEIKTQYPWFMKLPLRGEKYFVYFVRKDETFFGLLYPKQGDDLEQIKAEVTDKLKSVYGIPIENYAFEWRVTYK